MADLTACPAGMKLTSGDVANHPELSGKPALCVDETEEPTPSSLVTRGLSLGQSLN